MIQRTSGSSAVSHSTFPDRFGRSLSVIIPFAPEETEGAMLLDQLRALPCHAEILLACADGHQPPVDPESARGKIVVRICDSAAGRACQMNTAARTATGRWIWFLHADSLLLPHTLAALGDFLVEGQDALGYFDLRYRGDGPAFAQVNAFMANIRARWLGMPFGDQGFVLPTAWFDRLGGYDEQAERGEDHLLVWRARRAGLPLRRICAPLSSSARKYAQSGWYRTTVQNVFLTMRQAWPQWLALLHARGRRVSGRR